MNFLSRIVWRAIALATLCFLGAAHGSVLAKDGLYICAEHADPYDWQVEFSKGPIVIPAGTVFDYAGHIMGGNLLDPRDSAHFDHGKGNRGNSPPWTGISPAEIERRRALISQDFATDLKNTSAVATTKQVILTKTNPCALAEARVVLSKQWGWTISPIHGDVDIFYQAYGVIRRGSLDTNFDDDSVPLNFLAARGELNASVRGTIANELNLDQ